MKRNFLVHLPLLALTAALVPGLASAQAARSGGSQNTQLVQQLQQLASERTQLQQQNAKLQKDLEDMRKERDALKSGQQALQRRAEQSDVVVRQAQQGIAAQRQANDQETLCFGNEHRTTNAQRRTSNESDDVAPAELEPVILRF